MTIMQRNQSAHTAWEQPVTQEFTINNDSTIFTLQSKSTSEKNFAVHLVQQFFPSSKLEGWNVTRVENKLPLHKEKMLRIWEIVLR